MLHLQFQDPVPCQSIARNFLACTHSILNLAWILVGPGIRPRRGCLFCEGLNLWPLGLMAPVSNRCKLFFPVQTFLGNLSVNRRFLYRNWASLRTPSKKRHKFADQPYKTILNFKLVSLFQFWRAPEKPLGEMLLVFFCLSIAVL